MEAFIAITAYLLLGICLFFFVFLLLLAGIGSAKAVTAMTGFAIELLWPLIIASILLWYFPYGVISIDFWRSLSWLIFSAITVGLQIAFFSTGAIGEYGAADWLSKLTKRIGLFCLLIELNIYALSFFV